MISCGIATTDHCRISSMSRSLRLLPGSSPGSRARHWILLFVSAIVVLICLPGSCDVPDPAVQHWLSVSYLEYQGLAGFGEYPAEQLTRPTLYWTHGAVENAVLNALPILGSDKIASWVVTLLLPDGSFDDPTTKAPTFIETLWALRILRLLGDDLERFSDTRAFLEQSLDGLDLTGSEISEELRSALSTASLILACCEEFSAVGHPVAARYMDGLTSSLLELASWMNALVSSSGTWSTDTIPQLAAQYTLMVARVAPEHLSSEGRDFLQRHLLFVETAPAQFTACLTIYVLLTASSQVFAWNDVPQEIREGVERYLEHSILPILSERGGFGWTGYQGITSVDAQMTVPLIRLYSVLGQRYPLADAFATTLAPLRIPEGWIFHIQVTPDPNSSFYALALAKISGWAGFSEPGLLSYCRAILHSSDSSPMDVLYAAKGWAEIEGVSQELMALLTSRLQGCSFAWVETNIRSIVELLFLFNMPSETLTFVSVLEIRRLELVEVLSEASHVELLRELTMLDSLLGTESLSREAFTDRIFALYCEEGGFMHHSKMPESIPDVISTYMAIETLSHLGMSSAVSREALAEFILGCRFAPGYMLAPPDVLERIGESPYVELISTYCGTRLQQFVETGSL